MDKEKQKQAITEIMNDDAKDGLYKQQTAVEWLWNAIIIEKATMYSEILERAKQMERENQKYCWGKAIESVQSTSLPEFDSFEDYYNQTYRE